MEWNKENYLVKETAQQTRLHTPNEIFSLEANAGAKWVNTRTFPSHYAVQLDYCNQDGKNRQGKDVEGYRNEPRLREA